MYVMPFPVVTLVAQAEDRAKVLLAEVKAKAKTISTLSADLNFRVTGGRTQDLSGRLLLQRPGLGWAEYRTETGTLESLDLSDGRYWYQIQGKAYSKQASKVVPEQIWPYVDGIPSRGSIQPTFTGVERVGSYSCDVIEFVQPGLTARYYIGADKLIRRVVSILGSRSPRETQDLILSNLVLNKPISPLRFQLPAGLTEAGR